MSKTQNKRSAGRDAHTILLKLPNIQFLNSFVFPYDSFKSTVLFSVIVTIAACFLPTGGVLINVNLPLTAQLGKFWSAQCLQ